MFPRHRTRRSRCFHRVRFIAVGFVSELFRLVHLATNAPRCIVRGWLEEQRIVGFLSRFSLYQSASRLQTDATARQSFHLLNSISMALVSALLANSVNARVFIACPKIEPSTCQPSFHTFLSSSSPYLALDLFRELSRSISSCSSSSSSIANSALGADVARISLGSNPFRISSPSSSSSYVLLL